MIKNNDELEALRVERERDAKMEAAGYIIGPAGQWIHVSVWREHIATLRKRAERNPGWAP